MGFKECYGMAQCQKVYGGGGEEEAKVQKAARDERSSMTLSAAQLLHGSSMPSSTIFQFSHLLEESFVNIAFLPLWITLSNLLSYCMSLSLFGCLIGSSSTNQQYFPTNTALAFRNFQKAELSSTPIIRSHTSRVRKPLVMGRSFLGQGKKHCPRHKGLQSSVLLRIQMPKQI